MLARNEHVRLGHLRGKSPSVLFCRPDTSYATPHITDAPQAETQGSRLLHRDGGDALE